jgi:hypothetical protein
MENVRFSVQALGILVNSWENKRERKKGCAYDRAARNLFTKKKIDGTSQSSMKEMYKYIKGGMHATGAALWDTVTKAYFLITTASTRS